jgi:hypothetical protein
MRKERNATALGTCAECMSKSSFHLEDFGIGSYEFWGARGTDHQWEWVSDCCEAQPFGELDIPPDKDDFEPPMDEERERRDW